MYSKFKKLASARTFLEVDAAGVPSTERLRVCVAALLWQMANADAQGTPVKHDALIRALDSEFHSMDRDSEMLVETGAFLVREGRHFDSFIAEVNTNFDVEQREHLFGMLIKVARSDGIFSRAEQELALILREKLNLHLSSHGL